MSEVETVSRAGIDETGDYMLENRQDKQTGGEEKKILYVDDDPKILSSYQRNLGGEFRFETALSGAEGLELIREGNEFALVIADMKMPEMNGIEFLREVAKCTPDTVRVMLTGNPDQKTAVAAVNEGHVFQFLTKPCSSEQLASVIQAGLRQYELVISERELLEKTLQGVVRMLTEILSMSHPQIFSDTQHLREYVREFSGVADVEWGWDLEVAAMLTPVGHTALPFDLETKINGGDGLSLDEQRLLEKTPEVGAQLLSVIPRMERVSQIILYQNKHYDGKGYPDDDVAGESIPEGARVLKLLKDFILFERQGGRDHVMAWLSAQEGVYDPKLLQAVERWLSGKAVAKKQEEVWIRDLRSGMVLASDIQTVDGFTLLGAGHKISPVMLQRIRNFSRLSQISEPIWIEG